VTDDDLVTRYAQALQRHNDAAGLPLPVSASLGIASWDSASGTPDLQELIRTADASMYASKRRWHSALELGADIERTREEAGERDGQ
jgi:GGDEF domain-containing protein